MTVLDDDLIDLLDDAPAPARAVDIDELGRRVFALAAAVTVFVVGGAMVYYATQRQPDVDEFFTHYFTESPAEFLGRYKADLHPAAYYLTVLGLGGISRSIPFLRVASLLALSALAVVIALASTTSRRELGRHLALIAPAACGAAVFVDWGSDLRMYGALGVCSAVLAVTVYCWLDKPDITRRAVYGLAALVTLVATLHVWGALVAGTYTVVIAATLRRERHAIGEPERRALLLATLGAVVAVALAYVWGPLQIPDAGEMLAFNERALAGWVLYGVGANFGLIALFGLAWLGSVAVTTSRRSLLAFDIPAVTVVLAVWVVSQRVPIAREYSVIPVVVIGLVGVLVRLRDASGWAAAGFTALLCVNGAMMLDTASSSRSTYEETAHRLLELVDEDDPCPVLVFPMFNELHHVRFYTGERLGLVGMDDAGIARACDEGWYIANHLNGSRGVPTTVDTEPVFTTTGTAYQGEVGRYRLK